MKKLFAIFSALILVAVIGLGLFVAPYHYYVTALTEGIETEYLSVSSGEPSLYRGSEYQFERMEGLIAEDESRWKSMHFTDFLVPVPIRHPVYFLKPEVRHMGQNKTRFGFKFIDQRDREFAQVKTFLPFEFKFRLGRDLIFKLPWIKKFIMNKTHEQIWRDLFTLKLYVEPGEELSFFEQFERLKDLSYRDLAYRLFIYRTRKALFGQNIENLSFYSSKSFGVVRYKKPKGEIPERFEQEVIHILHKGVVYPISISSLEHSIKAEAYRRRFIKNLELKLDNNDSSIPLYALYKQLDYRERISHKGMIYLYMAWSHIPEKKEFLREMIQFLERGEGNTMFLTSLYEYSYEKFGTTFSSKELLKETPEAKLERKISEEIEKENRAIRETEMSIPEEGFESVEEKMEYHLKKAKKQGLDHSDQRDMLIMD